MTPLESFGIANRKLEALRFNLQNHPLERRWKHWQRSFFKRKFPRKKNFDPDLIQGDPEFVSVYEQMQSLAKSIMSRMDQAREHWDRAKEDLTGQITIIPGDTWNKAGSHTEGTYASQAWSACRYARGAAESQADHYRQYGLETDVRDVFLEYSSAVRTPEGYFKTGYHDYEVWVKADPLMIEVCDHKTTNLKEWIRACWARGTNPRVYHPFLPHGLEENLGLDYFGKDIIQ